MTAIHLGIDLGGTKALFICGDHEERSATGPAFSPEELQSRVGAFIAKYGIRPTAIGVAVPGLVGRDGAIAACDVLPKLAGWDAAAAFADLRTRVLVANDVKAALAEEMHDAESGATVGVVMAGTAVGAAFITEGRALIGAGGFAGELGYLPLSTGVHGEVKRLDELAGGSFIAAALGLSSDEMAKRAIKNDPVVLTAVRRGGEALGLGLASIINLLNPSRLAVGGGALSLPGYWSAAQDSALRHSLPETWRMCALTEVRTGARVAALGAIRLVSGKNR